MCNPFKFVEGVQWHAYSLTPLHLHTLCVCTNSHTQWWPQIIWRVSIWVRRILICWSYYCYRGKSLADGWSKLTSERSTESIRTWSGDSISKWITQVMIKRNIMWCIHVASFVGETIPCAWSASNCSRPAGAGQWSCWWKCKQRSRCLPCLLWWLRYHHHLHPSALETWSWRYQLWRWGG